MKKCLSILLILLLFVQSIPFDLSKVHALEQDSIRIMMFNTNTGITTNGISPKFKICNTGSEPVALKELKLRYYYTADGEKPQNFFCDYSETGASSVTGTFVKMPVAVEGADHYLEIGFSDEAGELEAAGDIELQVRFSKNDYTEYSQNNDYSFNAASNDYTDWEYTPAYVSETLVWGSVPGNALTPSATPDEETQIEITPTPAPTSKPTPSPTHKLTATSTPAATPTATKGIVVTSAASGEDDYTNSISQAKVPLKISELTYGVINTENDLDFFTFSPPVDGKYRIEGVDGADSSIGILYIKNGYNYEGFSTKYYNYSWYIEQELTTDSQYYFGMRRKFDSSLPGENLFQVH